MDRRTKILASLFGVAIAYVVLSTMVYPRWIRPLLTLDERVAWRTKVLAELEDRQAEVDAAKREYVALMARGGSTDIGTVENDLRSRLNDLIDASGLKDAKISGGRARTDRKTKLKTMFIDVTAVASLESSVKFLKGVAELPQLIRVPRPKLSPASSSRKKKQLDRVNLSVPIEVMVLPDQKVIGRVDLAELNQPENYVRHKDQDYALIWKRKPFMEYIPPAPLVVRIRNRKISVIEGARVQLQASSAGGDGKYTYRWTPSEGLDNPASAKTIVDTSKPLNQIYTVQVSDGAGQSAKQTISVTVNAKPKPKPKPTRVVDKGPKAPPPPPRKKPWPGGENMQISMALITGDGSQQVGELMVFDSRSHAAEYFKVGDDFDGGELVFLHQRGGVAVRNDEYFVYPIGMTLNRALLAEEAMDYPVLQGGAERDQKAREAIEKAARKAEEQAKAEKAAAEAAEKAKNAEPGQPVTKEGRADAVDTKQPKDVAGMNPKNEAGRKPKTIRVGQPPKDGKASKGDGKPARGDSKPAGSGTKPATSPKDGTKPAKGDAKSASKTGKSGGSKGAQKKLSPKPVLKTGEKDKKQGKKRPSSRKRNRATRPKKKNSGSTVPP